MRAKIYLSGPVEDTDDPHTWRDALEDEYGYINFINPMSMGLSLEENSPAEIVAACEEGVRKSDGMIVHLPEKQFTWGTPIEQYISYMLGDPVVVVTGLKESEIPMFAKYYSNRITRSHDEAIHYIDMHY